MRALLATPTSTLARAATASSHRARPTSRAFAARAAAGGEPHQQHDKQHKGDSVAVSRQQQPSMPAHAPARRAATPAWPMATRRPSSLLGSALFGDLDKEFDAMFNSIWGAADPFGSPARAGGGAAAALTTPLASAAVPRTLPGLGAVDVTETADHGWKIALDAPGVPKEQVEVSIADGILTVAGSRSEEKVMGGEDEGGDEKKAAATTPVVRERAWGAFSRSFKLPPDADADGVKASMEYGVLTLDIPRKPEAAPAVKKVAIEG